MFFANLVPSFSAVSVNKKRKLEQYGSQRCTPLFDFIQQRKHKLRPARPTSNHGTKANESSAAEPIFPAVTNIPDVSEVMRLARSFEFPVYTLDCAPQIVEEYTLDAERAQGCEYHIRLSVLQKPSSQELIGELYVDRDFKEGSRNGASCRFPLGTRGHAIRYIQQFTEIFTDKGRKMVKITRIVPGEPDRVTYTGTSGSRSLSKMPTVSQAAAQAVAQAAAAHAAQQAVTAITSPTINGHLAAPHQQLNLVVGVPGTAQIAAQASPPSSSPQQLPPQSLLQQTSPVKAVVPQPSSPTRPPNTDPAISALATSLMNSAQQFQADALNKSVLAAAQAAASTFNNSPNANSSPQLKGVNRKHISTHDLLSSRLNAPIQIVPPTILSQVTTSTPTLIPNSIAHSPQRLTALTSQLNAPPVIPASAAAQQACFSLQSPVMAAPTTAAFPVVQAKANHTLHAVPAQQVLTLAQNDVTRKQIQQQVNSFVEVPANMANNMPGLEALLAGTPSADNPIPGDVNCGTALLERLSAAATVGVSPPPTTPSPKPLVASSPLSSPTHPLSVSNLNLCLANLQGAMAANPGYQNVQVSIPGLGSSIALSLNVSTPSNTQPGVIVTTLPLGTTGTMSCPSGVNTVVTSLPQAPLAQVGIAAPAPSANHTMLLTNSVMTSAQAQMLQLPVAHVVTPGLKTALNQSTGLRTAPANSVVLPQLAPHQQGIQLVSMLRGAGSPQVLQVPSVEALPLVQPSASSQVTLKLPQPSAGSLAQRVFEQFAQKGRKRRGTEGK